MTTESENGMVCAVVTMFHVLEHLYEPASYLDAARDLLRPDGRLILQVPNAACWQFLLFGERWNGIDVPRHLIEAVPDMVWDHDLPRRSIGLAHGSDVNRPVRVYSRNPAG